MQLGPHPPKPYFLFGGELHRLMGAVVVPDSGQAVVVDALEGWRPVRMRRELRLRGGNAPGWPLASCVPSSLHWRLARLRRSAAQIAQ